MWRGRTKYAGIFGPAGPNFDPDRIFRDRPFQVEDIIGESVYKIRSPKGGKPKIIHFDRLKPFLSSAEVNDGTES